MSFWAVVFTLVISAMILEFFSLSNLYRVTITLIRILKKSDELVCMLGSEIRALIYAGGIILVVMQFL